MKVDSYEPYHIGIKLNPSLVISSFLTKVKSSLSPSGKSSKLRSLEHTRSEVLASKRILELN